MNELTSWPKGHKNWKKMLLYWTEIETWQSNSNLKLEIWFKQNSNFKLHFLYFKKLKIDEKIRFLGDADDQISAWVQKKFRKKTNRNSFFNF